MTSKATESLKRERSEAVGTSSCNRCAACSHADAQVFVEDPRDHEYFVERDASAQILRCDRCESLYQSPWPTSEETQTFYGENYQNYKGSRVPLLSSLYDWQQQRGAKQFAQQYGKCSILDFGCGQAIFLQNLHRLGYTDLVGYESSHREHESVDNNIPIYSRIDEIHDSGRRFDLIRLNHVIEHLAELDTVMSALAKLLAEDGRIIGQTPNAAHYTSGLMKTHWGALHYPYHTVIFSEDGMRRAAPRWGLELESTGCSTMPTGWAMSFENKAKHSTGSQACGRTPYYSLCLGVSTPFVLYDYLLSRKLTAIFDFCLVPTQA